MAVVNAELILASPASPAFRASRRPSTSPTRATRPARPSARRSRRGSRRWPSERIDIPLIIGGREIRTRRRAPGGDAARPRATCSPTGTAPSASTWLQAIAAAARRAREWSRWPWEDRAAVFLRAAELLATTWRATVNAATMLGQSKTAFQAEIDAAAELVDFWRFNPYYAQQLYAEQPICRLGMWNQLDYRPLEGFVYAVTPFNFTSIAGNLPTAPALMGNTVVWKPARRRSRAATTSCGCSRPRACRRASSTSCPATPRRSRTSCSTHRDLAGVHFTGSTAVFNGMWRTIGENIEPLPLLPADRGRDGRQGLHRRPRLGRPSRRSPWRSCAAASSTRARSARRRAGSTCRARSGTRCATASWR